MVIVTTNRGKIKGVQAKNHQFFLGIPYAKAPIDNLRFQEPQSMDPWNEVKDTTKFGPIAFQNQMDSPPINQEQSEDCLYLNIWTPQADAKSRPVMFWIHGGGFLIGSSSRPRLNGSKLATHGDVVVVNFNYRLGVLGFLNLPGIPPNIGILDQIAALRWVKENIDKFGGNANNITIFGESAGAMSVAILLAIPSVKGLFHKAIMESGAACPRDFGAERAKEGAEEFMSKLKLEKENINALREIPISKIIRVQKKICGTMLDPRINPFRPFIDGNIIPEQPLEIIQKGKANHVPLIIGYNNEELGAISDVLNQANQLKRKVILKYIRAHIKKRNITKENLDKLIEVYKKEMELRYPNNHFKYWSAILSDSMFRIPIIRQLEAHCKHQKDIYSYIFHYESPKYGYALHTFELPFVFNTLDTADMMEGAIELNEETKQLSTLMMDTWVNFARTNNPNHQNLPEWPPYDIKKRATMMLGLEPIVEETPLEALREIWNGII
ncbi:MAG: carboxylesterase/lipase family protein [Candidatus Hodarchaeota archaeon]